jgi:hypothetical protein
VSDLPGGRRLSGDTAPTTGVVVTGNTVSGLRTPGAKSNRLTDNVPLDNGTDARDGGLLATAGPPRRTAGSPDVFPSRPHAVVNR